MKMCKICKRQQVGRKIYACGDCWQGLGKAEQAKLLQARTSLSLRGLKK